MSTTDLDNRIAQKTRDAAPPAPLIVELWVTWAGSYEPELERTYDLHNATQGVILIQDLRSYALANAPVEIRTAGGGR